MSVIFSICLPLETITAIQNGESQIALDHLSNIPDGHYRLIHDVARNVVTAVNAVPYNIVPKSAPANVSATPPAFSPAKTRFDHDGPAFSPISPIYTPASPCYSVVSGKSVGWGKAPGGWGFVQEEDKFNLVIRDLMLKDEHFRVSSETRFGEIKKMYKERTATQPSALAFSIDSIVIDDDDDYEHIRLLGITNGTVITAKPKEEPQTMAVAVQDLVMREEVLHLPIYAQTYDLFDEYEGKTGLNRSDLKFTYDGVGDLAVAASWGRSTYLGQLGITTGSVVKVAPKQDITLIFRDHMLMEDRIKLNETDSFRAFASKYLDTTGHAPNVYFTFSGYELVEGSANYFTSAKNLGFTDESIVEVHPRRITPKAARAESVATGSSNFGGWD
ncbi:hypothetical protein LTR85_010435 [Meristemomyces frigidus]|nr:hypothetical protein LTR85_010435 [Meristemomyces frigidus]